MFIMKYFEELNDTSYIMYVIKQFYFVTDEKEPTILFLDIAGTNV